MTEVQSLCIAWLREDEWPLWWAADKDFRRDFKSWEARMEALRAQYESLGKRVVKVDVGFHEFVDWSLANGRKVDSNSRAAFAGYKGARKHTDH